MRRILAGVDGVRVARGIVLTATVVLVAACGGGKSTLGTSSSGTASATNAGASAPTEVRVGFDAAAQSLDPNKATQPSELAAVNLIGLNLTDGDNTSGTPEPALAKSVTQAPNGLRWTVKLRPGVEFSNGTPVTQADVVASLEHEITDKAAVNAGIISTIKSVTPSGSDGVVIHLSAPTPDLPTLLSAQFLSIWPKAGLAKGSSFFNDPYSGGRYTLKSWGGGQNIVLQANPHYFGGPPAIKTIDIETVDDPATRLAQVEAGQLDGAIDMPANVLKQVSAPARASFIPYYYGITSLISRDTNSLLSDVRIRQAINLAIDRNELNQVAFNGLAKPLAGFWPQGTPAYDPGIPTQPDYAKAKSLLAGTKCANGCTLTVTFSTSYKDWGPTAGVIFRNNLGKIGIHVKINEIDPAVATKEYFAGTFQSRIGTTAAQVNSASNILSTALQGGTSIAANFSGYNSPQMNALIKKAASLPSSQQLPVLKQIGDQFERDRPYIQLTNGGFFVIERLPDSEFQFLPNFSFAIPST